MLKLMVGKNLSEDQLQSIARTTLQKADKDKDGKISFEEFSRVRASRFLRMHHDDQITPPHGANASQAPVHRCLTCVTDIREQRPRK